MPIEANDLHARSPRFAENSHFLGDTCSDNFFFQTSGRAVFLVKHDPSVISTRRGGAPGSSNPTTIHRFGKSSSWPLPRQASIQSKEPSKKSSRSSDETKIHTPPFPRPCRLLDNGHFPRLRRRPLLLGRQRHHI